MALRILFEILEFIFLTLSAYWGLKEAAETLTYVRLRGLLLLLPPLLVVTFKYGGFLASFVLVMLFFLLERTGIVLSLMASIFAFTLFLIGAMASTIALGVLGTALHVSGYEMQGTLQELLHMAVMR